MTSCPDERVDVLMTEVLKLEGFFTVHKCTDEIQTNRPVTCQVVGEQRNK